MKEGDIKIPNVFYVLLNNKAAMYNNLILNKGEYAALPRFAITAHTRDI